MGEAGLKGREEREGKEGRMEVKWMVRKGKQGGGKDGGEEKSGRGEEEQKKRNGRTWKRWERVNLMKEREGRKVSK